MNYLNAISESNSVEAIVDIINSIHHTKDHLVEHYGWGDVVAKFSLNDYAAAQYAYEAALAAGYGLESDNLECHLDFIADEGAVFDKSSAVEITKLFASSVDSGDLEVSKRFL